MSNELVVLPPNHANPLPLLPLENGPVLPGLMASLNIPRGKSTFAVERALAEKQTLGLLLPKAPLKLLPSPKELGDAPELQYNIDELYAKGVSARILKKIQLPDGSMNLLVHGVQRFEITNVIQAEPFLCATVNYVEDLNAKDPEIEALARAVILQVKQLSESNPFFTEEMKIAMMNTATRSNLADLVAFAITLRGMDAQSFVETTDVKERFLKLLVHLRKEQEVSELYTATPRSPTR